MEMGRATRRNETIDILVKVGRESSVDAWDSD
jgi:hypothetical protein